MHTFKADHPSFPFLKWIIIAQPEKLCDRTASLPDIKHFKNKDVCGGLQWDEPLSSSYGFRDFCESPSHIGIPYVELRGNDSLPGLQMEIQNAGYSIIK
jgi:hypothetical protein